MKPEESGAARSEWIKRVRQLCRFIQATISVLVERSSGSPLAAELALQLYLASAQAASMSPAFRDEKALEEAAYEFVVQAFTIYEEHINESRAQYQALILVINALHASRNFSAENYELLVAKCVQHGSRLLKRPDQTRVAYACAQLWWKTLPDSELVPPPLEAGQDEAQVEHAHAERVEQERSAIEQHNNGDKVLAQLQRSLKVADSCLDPVLSVRLFVELLNQSTMHYERRCLAVTPKYINDLIDLIRTSTANIEAFDSSMPEPTRAAADVGVADVNALYSPEMSMNTYVLQYFQRTLEYIQSRKDLSASGGYNLPDFSAIRCEEPVDERSSECPCYLRFKMSSGNYNNGHYRHSGEYPNNGNNGSGYDSYNNNNSGGDYGGYNNNGGGSGSGNYDNGRMYNMPPGPPPPLVGSNSYAPPAVPPPSDDYYNSRGHGNYNNGNFNGGNTDDYNSSSNRGGYSGEEGHGNNFAPPSGGGYASMPGNDYGVAPPANMPVVYHRPEDIDFAGSQFPSWNTHTPTPPPNFPPGQGGNGSGGYGQPTHGDIPTYNIPQDIQQEASKVTLSNCRGRKRALLIGINYAGTKHMLKGCINDVHNIKKFITEHFGFKESDMVILTDDQRDNPRRMPTHENIIKAMKWLVSDARMNDSFFFHYSGHGSTVESKTGDEIDGNDETICPVDFESRGQIIDDVMNAIMVRPLPRGARLTAIFDCCHSASALDLPFKYNHMGKLKNEKAITYAGKGLAAASGLYLKGDIAGAIKGLVKSVDIAMTGDPKLEKARKNKSTLGDAIMFSGCKDDQTSADTKITKPGSNRPDDLSFTGAMSHALISSMNDNPHQTYVQLLQDVRKRLATKYTQVPQLSTGRLMDMNTIFIM
ncbi:Ca(2+)-dependent cysteine protease [Coemansia sp. RSA 2530]|nr:Ca(2+)-dependent cysteine protease [Coemansia sp. RSA 2530]